MEQLNLTAEKRTEFGKGAARRIRRDHKIPAVMYGHGTDPVHMILPGHETMLALRTANAVLNIDLEGKKQLALAKQVQRDPIVGTIDHVDLVIVKRGEKVAVEVAVEVTGVAESGTVVMTDLPTVRLLVEATHIPESVEVSVQDLPAGSQILAKDLNLPEGATLEDDEEALVVSVNYPMAEEPETSDEEGAEEEAEAPAEGE